MTWSRFGLRFVRIVPMFSSCLRLRTIDTLLTTSLTYIYIYVLSLEQISLNLENSMENVDGRCNFVILIEPLGGGFIVKGVKMSSFSLPLRVACARVMKKVYACMLIYTCASECGSARTHARENERASARVCMCMFSTSKVPEWTDITITDGEKECLVFIAQYFFFNVLKYISVKYIYVYIYISNALRPSWSCSASRD